MQHSNDNVLNLVPNALKWINHCPVADRKYLKASIFSIAKGFEIKLKKSLSKMSKAELEEISRDFYWQNENKYFC